MRFKRKIELRCVFDSVKKLHADVVRQNITNAGGPEASRYLVTPQKFGLVLMNKKICQELKL